jgi:hypothetical protein
MDLDDLLPQLDEFGKYQKILIWLVCLPACVPCGFCAFNQLFMAEVPEHWCRIPALELPGVTAHVRREIGVPKVSSLLRCLSDNNYCCREYKNSALIIVGKK